MLLLANYETIYLLNYSVLPFITNISEAVEGDIGDSVCVYVGIGVGYLICVIIVVGKR